MEIMTVAFPVAGSLVDIFSANGVNRRNLSK